MLKILIKEVIEWEDSDDRGGLISGEISAVISSTEYLSCRICHSKVQSDDRVLAKCSKCSALIKVSGCEKMKPEKYIVKDASSGREVTLSAFERTLS